MPQRCMCPNFNWEYRMIAALQRRKLNMFKWREGMLSPRALARGNPARVKFAAENTYIVSGNGLVPPCKMPLPESILTKTSDAILRDLATITGDPLHSRAACTQPCNVNTYSRAHCSPGARLCEQWGHGCVNNGARLCASARLCRGSPVTMS